MKQPFTPDPGKPAAKVDPERFEIVRQAILRSLPPQGAQGLTWAELAELIGPTLPERLFRHMGTVRWYTRAVQLDLEARGVIERVPGSKPSRLRRAA